MNPIAAAAAAALVVASVSDAAARMWKPTPTALAQDYLTIQHFRSETEMVMVVWMAPSILDDTAENRMARELATDYAMFLVAHAEITPYGEWRFRTPTDVRVETADGGMRQPIPSDKLPPLVAMLQSVMTQVLAQGVGALGQNAVTHVFDGTGIADCAEGALWVHYAGEGYEFVTPIPGCS